MANQTVYPYGTGGELPSSIGIINDLTTGGVNKALSAEMGKTLNTNLTQLGQELIPFSIDLDSGRYVQFIEKHGIINSGSTIDANVLVDVNTMDCAVVDCAAGDVFFITGKGGSGNFWLYAFADADGNSLINSEGNVDSFTNLRIVAPDGATKLIVNAYRSDAHTIIKEFVIAENVATNSKALANLIESVIVHQAEDTYVNRLNTDYVWIVNQEISANPFNMELVVYGLSNSGATTVYFFKKNTNGSFVVLGSFVIGSTLSTGVRVPIPDNILLNDFYVGFYSKSNGIAYNTTGEVSQFLRVQYSDIEQQEIPLYGSPVSINMAFDLSYDRIKIEKTPRYYVVVDKNGGGDYTSILEAMQSEPENTTIIVNPGIYEQDMTECLKKSVIVIGVDRNQCIIRDTDGRYGHHPLYVSCGYFSDLTIEALYVGGVSHELTVSDLGAYAVHRDTDSNYGIGKNIEFHHCNIRSDFFPAIGCGLCKDMTMIIDDCVLENRQIPGRGSYSNSGSLGALYFHDANGLQGDQFVQMKDCLLKSKLEYAMCPYQVTREPQNNRVFCEFINNVLHSEIGGFTNTIWFRNDPFNEATGIFKISIGYGNSIASINGDGLNP